MNDRDRNPVFNRAIELRRQGKKLMEIGVILELDPKTLGKSRWDIDGEIRTRDLAQGEVDEWAENRLWKEEWQADVFRDLEFPEQVAETFYGVVTVALANDQRYLIWLMRRLVDIGIEYESVEFVRHSPWWDALAGVPVLGEWLGEAEAGVGLTQSAKDYKPWNGMPLERTTGGSFIMGERGGLARKALERLPGPMRGKAAGTKERIGFRSAVRSDSDTLIRAIDREITNTVLTLTPDDSADASQAVALNGIRERIPLFDLIPRNTRYRQYSIFQLLLLLFRSDPPERATQ